MNSVNLIGRLTKDPEVRYTQTGTATVSFTLAVDRNLSREEKDKRQQNGQPTADFVRCVAFNKTAENIGKYFAKGHKMGIVGRIQTGSYQANDGHTVYTTDVVVNNFDFLESRNQQQNGGYQQGGYQGNYQSQQYQYQQPPQQYQPPQHQQPQYQPPQPPAQQQMSMDDDLPEGFTMINEDDIPF